MTEQDQIYNSQELAALQREVASLESVTMVAIEELEKRLKNIETVSLEDDTWISELDSYEIYTMEKLPSLSESIRQIQGAEFKIC